MNRVLLSSLLGGFMLSAMITSVHAQTSKEEVEMCIQTIEQMSGGKASAATKKLCEEGKMEEAIATAMGG